MKRRWIIFSVPAFAAMALVTVLFFLRKPETYKSHRPNVLVVSACSLRIDRLGAFNPESKLTPKIDEWARGAFRFTNAIAERPWQNYTYEGSDIINRWFLGEMGYKHFIDRLQGYRFYVPPVEINRSAKVWYWNETAILSYNAGLEELRSAVMAQSHQPFYIFAHLKYLHYPYLDTVNMNDDDWHKLSPRSQELLAKYRAHPENFDAQLPMIELLLNSFTLLKKKLGVKDVFAVAGVVSDPARNLRWQASPDFADDLKLVRELYDLKMPRFDDFTSEILNLYGDRDLQSRTVVIFAGDHGEAFSEHGVIGHSVNVYDEMLRFPVVVKFPGSRNGEKIETQLTHQQLALLAHGIIEGTVVAENFAEKAREISSDYVLSRNCPDTIRGARYRSEWKLIKNLDSGQNELYNLRADPLEKKNLIAENPDMAWKLEEYMVDHLGELQRDNRNGVRSKVCTAN